MLGGRGELDLHGGKSAFGLTQLALERELACCGLLMRRQSQTDSLQLRVHVLQLRVKHIHLGLPAFGEFLGEQRLFLQLLNLQTQLIGNVSGPRLFLLNGLEFFLRVRLELRRDTESSFACCLS